MQPSEELWYDHEVLRDKLALLETLLPSIAALRWSVSRLTESLACCLRAHTEKEEVWLRCLPPHHADEGDDLRQRLHDAHENQRTRLAILHELLTYGEPVPEEQIAIQAAYLIHDLRAHMAEEEAALFPLLDRAAAGENAHTVEAMASETVQFLDLA